MGKLTEIQKENIQEMIKNEYDLAGKPKKYNSNAVEMDVREIYSDNAMQEILNSYNKKYNTDIQKQLRAYLEPTTMEKVRSSIEGEDIKEIKEKEQKEIETTISSVSKDGIGMDSNTKKEVEQELEEKKKKEPQEITEENLRATVLKAMYKTTLEKYYNLKLNLQEGRKGQIETGDISVGEKQGTELLLYEKYLKSIDERYRGISKKSVIRDDEDIKEYEEELAVRSAKNEEYVLNRNENDIKEVYRLYEKRNSLATDIAYLGTKAANMSPEKFKKEMDAYQKEYIEISSKLHNINPNPFELQKSIDEKNDLERARNTMSGYNVVHERELGGRVIKEERENDFDFKDNVEDLNKINEKSDKLQDKSTEDLLDKYYEAEERGNYSKAEEILQSLEMISGVQYDDKKITNGQKEENKEPKEIDNAKEKEEPKKGGIFDDPRMSATNNEEEVSKIEADKNDRKRRVNLVEERLNVKRSRNEAFQKEEYVPTLNNRKG